MRLQCARVRVPLDWARPTGAKISLALIRHLASSMFVNPGGPGQSGVKLVRDGGSDFDAWGGGRFDVVGWDPRGTNASDPVRCFTSEASQAQFWRGVQIPTTPAESRAYERKTIALARRCGRVSGELLAHISTADTARDLDYLRQLVGDHRLTYVGLDVWRSALWKPLQACHLEMSSESRALGDVAAAWTRVAGWTGGESC